MEDLSIYAAIAENTPTNILKIRIKSRGLMCASRQAKTVKYQLLLSIMLKKITAKITKLSYFQTPFPLNIISITASSTKLKKELDLLTDKMLTDALKLISETTEHLSNTIDVFKDFLKEDKEKSLFNLSQNINNNIALIETILNENQIKVDLDLDNDIYLYNFSNEFSQALINILHNASDAFASKVKENELRLIKITTKKIEDCVIIEILDNAGGINKDIINKIFEPYFTTKHQYQGTGLGLYMTHKIIQSSMKGKISVKNDKFIFEDKEYKGAHFKITLKNNT